jgi:hypothetical protein
MDFDILKVLSYTVVVITVLTMIFGVIAYYFYKLRERRRKIDNAKNSGEEPPQEKDKYLYFEEKELL